MDQKTRAWARSLSTRELVAAFLADPDCEEGATAIGELHGRGGIPELRAAVELMRSELPEERIAGARILGQLGFDPATHLEESVSALLGLLDDPSEDVIAAAANALGHRGDPRSLEALVRLAAHPSPRVRCGVAQGLSSGYDDLPLPVLAALITLSADADRDVRSWATFVLAQQIETDTPAIRAAFVARAGDEDAEVRGEALIGLAKRDDPRALGLIRRELLGEFEGSWAVQAAAALADPVLLPLLRGLLDRLGAVDREVASDFEHAIEACAGRSER